MSFVLAEHLCKDDLLIIRNHGTRAIQPEYEDMYFVVDPPQDIDSRHVLVSLISMWEDNNSILGLIVSRWELVEIGRLS